MVEGGGFILWGWCDGLRRVLFIDMIPSLTMPVTSVFGHVIFLP